MKGSGCLLWDAVVHHLALLEADYFDLEYTNSHGDEVSPQTCTFFKGKHIIVIYTLYSSSISRKILFNLNFLVMFSYRCLMLIKTQIQSITLNKS